MILTTHLTIVQAEICNIRAHSLLWRSSSEGRIATALRLDQIAVRTDTILAQE